MGLSHAVVVALQLQLEALGDGQRGDAVYVSQLQDGVHALCPQRLTLHC